MTWLGGESPCYTSLFLSMDPVCRVKQGKDYRSTRFNYGWASEPVFIARLPFVPGLGSRLPVAKNIATEILIVPTVGLRVPAAAAIAAIQFPRPPTATEYLPSVTEGSFRIFFRHDTSQQLVGRIGDSI